MPVGWNDVVVELEAGQRVPVRVRGQIPGRVPLRRAAPLVLHLHGGAFQDTACTGTGHLVASLLARAGAVVVSADYPCGKGHPFPEALELVFALLQQLDRTRAAWAGRACGLFVAGEEAGGNLAAALAMMARDRQGPKLAGQILLSPMLDPRMATCSARDAEAGPVGCRWADGWHSYLGSPEKASHPYAAPSGASRLAGLAPALVLTATGDPMQDESLSYARRLQDSGVAVQCHTLQAGAGWPDALSGAQAGTPATDPCWADALSRAAADFFMTTLPRSKPARGPDRVRSDA